MKNDLVMPKIVHKMPSPEGQQQLREEGPVSRGGHESLEGPQAAVSFTHYLRFLRKEGSHPI